MYKTITFGNIYPYIVYLLFLENQCASDIDCAKFGKEQQCCTRSGNNQGKCFEAVDFAAKCT